MAGGPPYVAGGMPYIMAERRGLVRRVPVWAGMCMCLWCTGGRPAALWFPGGRCPHPAGPMTDDGLTPPNPLLLLNMVKTRCSLFTSHTAVISYKCSHLGGRV